MNRRSFVLILATLAGCSGAGVSTDYLRDEVAAELSFILVNRSQLAPWTEGLVMIDRADLDGRIGTVRQKLSQAYTENFSVPEMHELRRFFSSPDGQVVAALAYAEEGNRPKPEFTPVEYDRVGQTLDNPLNARSIAILRGVLREAFSAEFAFDASLTG